MNRPCARILLLFTALALFGCASPAGNGEGADSAGGSFAAQDGENLGGGVIGALGADGNDSATETPNRLLVLSVLNSYNESDPLTYSNINLLLDCEVADILPLLHSSEPDEIWTGLYLATNVGHRSSEAEHADLKAALAPYLQSGLPSYRFLAATAMLAMGEKEAIPEMISLLSEDEILFRSEPPISVCAYSEIMLERYSENDFGPACTGGEADEAAASRWKAWWRENNGSLRYDRGLYRVDS